MKQNGKHLRVVVALLMAVMMLFSVLAVTAYAADDGEKNVTEYDTPWYTIKYTALSGDERAKVDVRIKTEYSKFLDIRREDLAELKDEVFDIIYHLAIDSLLAESEAEGEQEEPAKPYSMRKRLSTGDLGFDDDLDLSHIDIAKFEDFIRSHLTSAEAKEKVEAILNSEFDTVIQLVVDKYVTEQGYAYEDIEAKVNVIIVDLIPEIYADEPEKIVEMEQTITGKITEIVDEAKEIKESGKEIELSLSDLKSIRALTVNGESVFSDGSFRIDAIKSLIADLPRPSDIKDFSDTEMVLNYTVDADFVFGVVSFDFSIGFEGDCSEIRAVMGIISEYVTVDYTNGSINVAVTVPEKFGELLIKAINSDKLSDDLKHKIFSKIGSTAADVESFVAGLEFGELIELLESVDFEAVLSSDFVSRYVDLSHLTNEQIVEKVKQYESYYNKAKDLALRAMNKIPDSYMEKNIFDLYEGNGEFYAQKTATVNIENVLSKITEKYAALIASFIDGNGDGTVTVSGSLSVSFENVNRVTYMLGNDVHLDGFLPVGADVAYFANISEYNGYKISAWADKDGNVYTEMPDHDVVLYAYGALNVNVSENIDAVYESGKAYTITATPVYVTATPSVSYTYEWFFGGVSLGVTEEAFITVSDVKDSGEYYCVVTVNDNGEIKTATSDKVTVQITKADIGYTVPTGLTAVYGDMLSTVVLPEGFTWQTPSVAVGNVGANKFLADYTPKDADNYNTVTGIELTVEVSAKDITGAVITLGPSLTYNGTEQTQTVTSVVLGGVEITYTVSGNTATDAGVYTLTVTGTGNYSGTATAEFTVATADAAGAVITLGPSLTYNGTEQTQTVVSVVINGITATEYTVSGNVATNANTYTLTVTLGGNFTGTVTKEWTIAKKDITGANITLGPSLTYNGTEQTQTVVSVEVDGLTVTYTVSGNTGKNASDAYLLTVTGTENFTGTVTKSWSIAKAKITIDNVKWDYDPVNDPFVYDGTTTFTVSLILPENLTAEYNGNTAINAGEYTANYTFVYDSENYELEGIAVSALVWKVEKASHDMSGITFEDVEVVYDGESHSIFITGELPNGVTVSYENNGQTEVGEYTVTAKFTVDANYCDISDMTATLKIKAADTPTPPGPDDPDKPDDPDYPLINDFAVKDENGNIIVSVDAVEGLPNGTEISADNKYQDYKDIDLSAILEDGKIGIIGNAYDITFSKNGEGLDISTGSFTVRLVIPENLRSKENLIVIHIADSGEVSVMEGSKREGDYMVFDTTHFSVYAVVALDDAPEGFDWLTILLIILLVAAVIIVILIVFRRGGGSSSDANTDEPDNGTDDTDAEGDDGDDTSSRDYDVVDKAEDVTPEDEPEGDDEPEAEEKPEEETDHVLVAVEETPTEETPTEETPVEETPVEETPVEEAPAEEAPKDEVLVEIIPVDADTAEEPTEEAPVEETPAEETPIEETPTEETPTEETPTEETPTEETPTEETPIEETPADTSDATPVIIANEDDSIIVDGQVVYVRYRSSFTSRLIQAEEPIQDYYTAIKNHILSYKGVKSRTSWNYELFNKGREQCVKLNIKGKAITLELPLDPKQYNVNKYHFTDRSDSERYAKLPMLMKVKSARSLKYAIELIDEVMKLYGIPKLDTPEVDYHMPYETNRELAIRGLVKVILPAGVKIDDTTLVLAADVSDHIGGIKSDKISDNGLDTGAVVADEEPTEDTPTEDTPAEDTPTEEAPKDELTVTTAVIDSISDDDTILVGGDVVMVRYRSSFTSRLIQASEELQDYYTAIKNRLLSYKGVKARTSWNYENFSRGRVLCARLNIKGKTLTLNLALATAGYNENKYHFTDMSDDPKFEKLPMLLKVRSARSLKYALELIDELMSSLSIPLGKPSEESYRQAYEPNRELAKRGLVKLILPKGVKISDSTVLEDLDVDTLFGKNKKDETPTEETLRVENIAEETPVEETPAEEVPTEETPVEEAPAEETPTEETPTEETPAEEAPAEEAPAEETPAEETPVEETPTEETPAEETPVEETPAEEAPAEETPTEDTPVFTSVAEADAILTDSDAEEKIEILTGHGTGKMVEVNIGDICDNFNNGDVVTIIELKKKHLISAKAGRVKVLASGRMTKSLTVVADKFSLQAVKMITLAGGTAKQYE